MRLLTTSELSRASWLTAPNDDLAANQITARQSSSSLVIWATALDLGGEQDAELKKAKAREDDLPS